MEEYKKILKRTGIVLIAVGVIDALIMFYCISHGFKYKSLLSVFAVVGGIFLTQNNLKAANIVSFFSALLFAWVIGLLILFPFNVPLKLQATFFRLHSLLIETCLCAVLLIACLLLWIYSSLTSAAVMREIEAGQVPSGFVWKRPVLGFLTGGCLVILLNVFIVMSKQSAEAETLVQKAKLKAGGDYQYYLSSFSKRGAGDDRNNKATVIAYSGDEIKKINIEEQYERGILSSISFDVVYDKPKKQQAISAAAGEGK